MTDSSGVLAASAARSANLDPIKLRERLFFSGMAIALAVTVFAGFAPTYDLATLRRLHPATLWGGLFLVASQPLRLVIAGTESWMAAARWLTS